MRKLILILLCIIFLTFLIPILFTRGFQTQEVSEETELNTQVNNIENITEEYTYSQYGTIRLLHAKTGEVEELNIDDYLLGVVSAEMPASFEEEALKAQAVVARTYTIYKIVNNDGKHEEADICDDSTCCQAWISEKDRKEKWKDSESETNWQKIVNAVNGTQGKIITYEGKPINAFFHSNSGGETEAPIDVWGRKRLSLSSVCCNCRRRYI